MGSYPQQPHTRSATEGFAKCIDLVSYFGRQSYPRSCSD
ncbi:hypothetical protein BFJ68_g5735 [Fusarium oxysporum]|uniref:Uncharacterized protein n=1 Tax=Fusarium oxysporum TaxID=5507 RepID=A0A420P613_FUSOX|nr:hypothetical protein BFJ71_g13183 [Fusarium oxysporum]RKL15528.1 hypothetical protein BFJ68_g5735 [Fusarium oxysporum]